MGKFEIKDGCLVTYDDTSNDKEVTVPEGVITIGEYAFYYHSDFEKINLPDTVKIIHFNAFEGCDFLKEITIPDSVEMIEENILISCNHLEKINISENSHLKELKSYAFISCYYIESLYIPASVEKIGNNICLECYQLKRIEVSEKNQNYCDIDGVLFNKNRTELLSYPIGKPDTFYQIPDTVETIKQESFELCFNIEKIVISSSVKKIEDFAFCHSDIKEITFSDTIEYFGGKIFEGCSKLKKIFVQSQGNFKYIILCDKINESNELSHIFYCSDIKAEEFEDKLMKRLSRNGKIELALSRLYYQNHLSEEQKIFYQNYLSRSGKYALAYCIKEENEEYLRIAAESGSIKKSNITWAIDYAREKQNLNITAFLMDYQYEKELK